MRVALAPAPPAPAAGTRCSGARASAVVRPPLLRSLQTRPLRADLRSRTHPCRAARQPLLPQALSQRPLPADQRLRAASSRQLWRPSGPSSGSDPGGAGSSSSSTSGQQPTQQEPHGWLPHLRLPLAILPWDARWPQGCSCGWQLVAACRACASGRPEELELLPAAGAHSSAPLPASPPPCPRSYQGWSALATAAAALTGFLIPWEVAFLSMDELYGWGRWAGGCRSRSLQRMHRRAGLHSSVPPVGSLVAPVPPTRQTLCCASVQPLGGAESDFSGPVWRGHGALVPLSVL